MKQSLNSGAIVVVLCILFLISSSAARLLGNKEGQMEVKLNIDVNHHGGSPVELKGSDQLMKLMGVEDCTDGDEDCLKRRMMAEVHLDYIYTQHHKP